MANPAINFAGFLYDDAGDAISGATVNLYDKNTSTTSRASTTTDSNGAWSIAHTTAGEFDVQITSGSSKRRIKFDDKVHLSELDTEVLNVRGNEGQPAPMYWFADEGDDAGDRWLFNAAAGGVFTMGNDIQSQGTYVAHVTITPNATVANSTFAIAGLATIAGKLTLSDGFAVGSDANGDILYSNGTKYVRLGRGSDGDVLTLASSVPSWATPTTGDITAVTAGDGLSGGGTSGGVTLALDLNELTGATLADGDSLVFIDANDSNGSRKEAFADVLDTIAGTVATTGLDRSGATLVLSDLHPVGVSGSNNQLITDDGDGTVTSESNLTFDGSVLTVTGSVDTTLDQHFDSSPSDETVSGITATFTAGEALERGEVVYFKAGDSKMWKAVATAAGTMPVAAMAAADISADATGKFLLYGFLADNGTFPAYTVGGDLYAPEAETSSQNVPEQTAPDSDGDFVQVVGYAVTANSVFFDPDQTVVEVA